MPSDDNWKDLCAKAAVEKDPKRLLELVREINQILEEREKHKQSPRDKIQ